MTVRRKLAWAALVAGLWLPVTGHAADAEEEARILHLAKRASFGATSDLVDEIRRVGRARWIAQQLAPSADPPLAARLARYPALDMDSAALLASYPQRPGEAAGDAIGRPGRILAEVSADVVTRAVHARAQIAEVMTDFWLNHFNVYAAEGPTRYSCVAYVRDAIRPHALGRFRDLLLATAESPAMLYYLDNYLSSSPSTRVRRKNKGLNENYARELLELHTLGVAGGYTQNDVVEVARVFTGWTITQQRSGRIEHVFVPRLHEPGVKTVLGHRVAQAGRDEGVEVLDMLARERATAELVARKLVSRFVADVPPASLVERAKGVFLATDGNIAWVVATILTADEFYAPEHRDTKVKSPLELLAGALRTARADVRLGFAAATLVGNLGQPILRAQPPIGWSETAAAVVSAGGMVTRFDAAYLVASGRIAGVRVDAARWTELAQSTSAVDALTQEILLSSASAATRTALEEARAAGARPALLAALVLSSPEFQQQ